MAFNYDNIDPSWKPLFEDAKGELEMVEKYMPKGEYYPKDVFKAFELTPLVDIRVVIIGQDPYHSNRDGVPIATGLAFSVREDETIPPSLVNIFKEIKACIPNTKNESGDLTSWARQGVFLLNMTLTVSPGKPNSHNGVWDGFIYKVIRKICSACPKVVFLLWGKNADKVRKYIGLKTQYLSSGHPSPLSVKYFQGNGHFKKVNEILGENAIDWST